MRDVERGAHESADDQDAADEQAIEIAPAERQLTTVPHLVLQVETTTVALPRVSADIVPRSIGLGIHLQHSNQPKTEP